MLPEKFNGIMRYPKEVSRYGGTKLLIAPTLACDEIMKKVPKGKVITSDYIRNYQAKRHGYIKHYRRTIPPVIF